MVGKWLRKLVLSIVEDKIREELGYTGKITSKIEKEAKSEVEHHADTHHHHMDFGTCDKCGTVALKSKMLMEKKVGTENVWVPKRRDLVKKDIVVKTYLCHCCQAQREVRVFKLI